MKFRCKKCHKQQKSNSRDNIQCDKSDCDVKFNMTDEALDFKGFYEGLSKDIQIIDDFKSEAPKESTKKTWTEEEWGQYLVDQGMVGPQSSLT